MPRYTHLSGEGPQAERIRQLENELWQAKHTIVELAPDPLSTALSSFYSCKSYKDFWDWERSAILAVIGTAKEDPSISHLQPRAYCPLCRGGSQGPYDRGFSIPEGLRRHLEGHGNTSKCPVTEAAFWLARRGLQGVFEAEEREKQCLLLERRQSERLFLINPDEAPKLLDEGMWRWGDTARDAVGLDAAGERLRALGFVAETNGNVTAWRLRHESWVVLADPRPPRAIDFVVYAETDQGRTRRNASRRPSASFSMQDAWRHDIPKKFGERLAAASKSLQGRGRK